ncbi:MAG: hypothetical protein KF878_22340 [Planctomycetes bacterium]|nr:hypothetical protein [Planctomycetota bacterium]
MLDILPRDSLDFVACPDDRTIRLVLDWDMVMQRYDRELPGPVVVPEELSLSADTVAALWSWYGAYSDLAHWSSDRGDDLHDLDWRLIEEEGLRQWSQVRAELGPSYHVYYSSLLFDETFAHPDEYERIAGDERTRLDGR